MAYRLSGPGSNGFARPAVAIALCVATAALVVDVPAQAAIKYAVHRYTTEGKAHTHCPKDAIVYSTGRDGVYFLKGDPQYCHIKNAWYVCRREADHGGWHLQEH
jgi:hypothetical protein